VSRHYESWPSRERIRSSSGHEQAARNFSVLYSLVQTAERHGVNALAYLEDVLLRVQTHPAARIDELLPDRWKPPDP